MSTHQDIEDVMSSMVLGPPRVRVVIVNYSDSKTRCFVFDDDDIFQEFVQHLEEGGDELEATSYTYYESLVNVAYDHEYKFWTTEH